MGVEDAPVVPPVRGYAAGEEVLFIHTEASDPEIAEVLIEMMRSPALVVVTSLGYRVQRAHGPGAGGEESGVR